MSREIWFRGKCARNVRVFDVKEVGTWVYGFYRDAVGLPLISEFDRSYADYIDHEIDETTLGQYTGRTDSKGIKIFDGDILGEWTENEKGEECLGYIGVVTYWEREGRYVLTDKNGHCNDWTLEDEAKPENWDKLLIIGNIYDNPELLEDEE